MKVLITESIAEESVQYLKDEGYEVEEYLAHSQEEIEQHILLLSGVPGCG